MVGKFKKVMIALTMGATLAGLAASPAEARRYYSNRHHDHISTGAALGIGLLGLGLGIAAAQNNGYRGDYDYYYDAPPPRYEPPRRYYREYRDCWQERVWDNYYRSWILRTVCR